jgi:hypothetical protein
MNKYDFGQKPHEKCPLLAGKDNIKMDLRKHFLMDERGMGMSQDYVQ